MTIAELLSHQAGLAALSRAADVQDHAAVAAALAAEAPHWPLGEGHGYHPRTFGFLVDEVLRRITGGVTLRDYWRAQFAEPLGLDVWIGMPPERVAEASAIFPAKTTPPKGDPFYTAFMTPGSLTARAFASPRGLHSVASMNAPEARAASFGAFGGIGTARGLAKFYALLAGGGMLDGRRFFEPRTLDWMTTTLTQGHDRVLQIETAFSAGFMRDPLDAHGAKLRTQFRSVVPRLRPSRRRGQPRFRRSGHRHRLRLRNEPDGARRFARSEMPAPRRRALRLKCGWVEGSVGALPSFSPATRRPPSPPLSRRCGARRCSKTKMPCHVPSCRRPSATGTTSLVRVSTMRRCEGMSSGPSAVWTK